MEVVGLFQQARPHRRENDSSRQEPLLPQGVKNTYPSHQLAVRQRRLPPTVPRPSPSWRRPTAPLTPPWLPTHDLDAQDRDSSGGRYKLSRAVHAPARATRGSRGGGMREAGLEVGGGGSEKDQAPPFVVPEIDVHRRRAVCGGQGGWAVTKWTCISAGGPDASSMGGLSPVLRSSSPSFGLTEPIQPDLRCMCYFHGTPGTGQCAVPCADALTSLLQPRLSSPRHDHRDGVCCLVPLLPCCSTPVAVHCHHSLYAIFCCPCTCHGYFRRNGRGDLYGGGGCG